MLVIGCIKVHQQICLVLDGNLNIIGGNRTNQSAVVKVVELAGNTNQRTYSPFWAITGGTAYLNSYSGGGYYGTSTMTVEEVEL